MFEPKKYFGSVKCYCSIKTFGPYEILELESFQSEKIFSEKHVGSKKNFGQQNFGSTKFLCQKKNSMGGYNKRFRKT